jgi:endonuclease/exonuclease/phosphatase (EEP) superfamily protein YafD
MILLFFFRSINNPPRRKQCAVKVFTAIGSGMIFTSLFGLLLGICSFGVWPFETANLWIPGYLLLSVLGTCAHLLRKQLRRASVGFVCVVVCLAMIAPHWWSMLNRPVNVHNPNLRILTANVYYEGNDAAPLLKLIQETKPDIVVLQEVDDKWRKMLAPLEKVYAKSHFSPRYKGGEIDLAQYWSMDAEAPEELYKQKIPAISTVFRINDRPLEVLNVHTASPFTPKRARHYREQMRLLTRHAAEQKEALILAGDFNSGLWSWHYKKMLKATALRNIRDGFGILGSWPSFMGPLRIALDHILISPEIEVVHCWTVSGMGSDHSALLADLYLE